MDSGGFVFEEENKVWFFDMLCRELLFCYPRRDFAKELMNNENSYQVVENNYKCNLKENNIDYPNNKN